LVSRAICATTNKKVIMCIANRHTFEKTLSRGLEGSTTRNFRAYPPHILREHKIDCIRTVIARSVSDEAISEMSLTMKLRRSLQLLAMTIGGIIRCKLFIALGSKKKI
jgi:hypothetical protein